LNARENRNVFSLDLNVPSELLSWWHKQADSYLGTYAIMNK